MKKKYYYLSNTENYTMFMLQKLYILVNYYMKYYEYINCFDNNLFLYIFETQVNVKIMHKNALCVVLFK